MRIVVIGGTGFVGQGLVRRLAERGDEVIVASRSPSRAQGAFPSTVTACALETPELRTAISGSAAVVNLAGENVMAGRWTEARKARLRASRIDVTDMVVGVISGLDPTWRPRALVNASAIGWYGDRGEDGVAEDVPAGRGFLAALCRDWEAAARRAEGCGVRVALPRLGVVLGRDGGALEPLALQFRLFAGGAPGSGRQWVSWIHLDDLHGMLERAIDDDAWSGPINAVAPEPVRMERFAGAIGHALGRPSWLPAPAALLRAALGERADAVLDSVRAVPKRALELGFAFRFPTIEPALDDLLARGD